MSQPTKTTSDAANGSNTPVSSVEQTTTIVTSKNGIKRTISDETEHQVKKLMVGQCSSVTHTQNLSKSSIEIKFVSAAQVATTNSLNNDSVPEISDEELLAMALMMEKNEQQQ